MSGNKGNINSSINKYIDYFRDLLKSRERNAFERNLEKDPFEWKNLAGSPEYEKKKKELIAGMKAFQRQIKDPFLDKRNLDAFENEQIQHQKINYRRKKGFTWPHLEMFKNANKE